MPPSAVYNDSSNGSPAPGYTIPDITYGSPQNRRLRVIVIGAGVSGIQTAYYVQKECQNIDLKIFDREATVGGTWLVNRYPGCACDIPSHAYSLNFALNPDWPLFFSGADDIQKYLEKVVEVFGLRQYMRFRHTVLGTYWNEGSGTWTVKLRQMYANGLTHEYEETCDLLLQATGVLSRPKMPAIEGLQKFKGKVIHTGEWDQTYTDDQWNNDRVGVIGSGASSIQAVATMQPAVKHMDIFVRTAIWFTSLGNNYGNNHEYTAAEKKQFRQDPKSMISHAREIEDAVNGDWSMFFSDSQAQQEARTYYEDRMTQHIKDPRLLKGFTPKWAVGCRRVTPGDPYMKAIQQPNVDVHFTGVKRITVTGIIGDDNLARQVDTIVCATGYDVTYHPHYPVVDRNHQTLAKRFGVDQESYLGVAAPDFPNLILFGAPTWPVENGSALGPLTAVTKYAVQVIKKMQKDNIKALDPRHSVTDLFNQHVQTFIKSTVWTENCRSWYKNNDTGKVFAVWPGSSLQFMQAIESPRYEDFDIEYHYDNM